MDYYVADKKELFFAYDYNLNRAKELTPKKNYKMHLYFKKSLIES